MIRLAEVRLGAGVTDILTGSTSQIAQKVFDALEPKLADIVKQAAEAAEPTMRTVAREEIAPQVALALGGSVLLGAILAGLVGSWFASRGRRAA